MVLIYIPTGSEHPDKVEEQKQLINEFLADGWKYQGKSVFTTPFQSQIEVAVLEKRELMLVT